MNRVKMINVIGEEYLTENIENGEYSYPQAYKKAGLDFEPIGDGKRNYEKLDIRFESEGVSILVETKDDFTLAKNKKAPEQLAAYIDYEKKLTGNKVIAILANTKNDDVKVWRGRVSDETLLENEDKLKGFKEYVELFNVKNNNKEAVMKSTYRLNEYMHSCGIPEKIRSQFVGTCMIALKDSLDYKNVNLTTAQILAGIKGTLEKLLNGDINKATKLTTLYQSVFGAQSVRDLDVASFRTILKIVDTEILPSINDKSTAGQDLLNLFFTSFNKYVNKDDKNQAFTPDHITHFIAKVTGVNKNSRVLDPCCGSGAFLVRAMVEELNDCTTDEERDNIKKNNIYGIEYSEKVAGLAMTNMLIHGDGNTNIMTDSCFNRKEWIKNEVKPNVVLMNPPYNCTKLSIDKAYSDTWKASQKEDPSKGLYFVKWVMDTLNEAKLNSKVAVVLPVSCAIGSSTELKKMKAEILKNNTLDAVFSLPGEVFYPGASVNTCVMVFTVGVPNDKSGKTFFGYYKEDGFKKKKNLGRVEQFDADGNSKWEAIEKEWISLYQNRTEKAGLSALHDVTGEDEWLCEAYMETDYSVLTNDMFQATINNYLAYLIKEGKVYE